METSKESPIPDDYVTDGHGRTFREVSAIRRWLAHCEKETAFYIGRKVQFWSNTHICTKVYFTEPGLVPYFHLDGYPHNPVPGTAWLRWFPRIGDTVQVADNPHNVQWPWPFEGQRAIITRELGGTREMYKLELLGNEDVIGHLARSKFSVVRYP